MDAGIFEDDIPCQRFSSLGLSNSSLCSAGRITWSSQQADEKLSLSREKAEGKRENCENYTRKPNCSPFWLLPSALSALLFQPPARSGDLSYCNAARGGAAPRAKKKSRELDIVADTDSASPQRGMRSWFRIRQNQ
jgi:hypothetical protein